MSSIHSLLTARSGRSLALLLCLSVGFTCSPSWPLAPAAGLPEYQELAAVDVPGGRVNVLGGNLIIRRADLSIDTRLGTREIGATYNSSGDSWLWDFDVRYDGSSFLDATGALLDVSAVAPGEAVPGTVWVVVDGDTLKTKGGLLHEFDARGRLAVVRWSSSAYPRLVHLSDHLAGDWRTTAIRQCTDASSCTDVFDIGYDAAGRVLSIVDRAGRRAQFVYEADGRLASARDGLDTARGWPGFRYEYAGGHLVALTGSEAERVEYAYDGAGRLVSVRQVGEGDPTHQLAYQPRNASGLYRTRLWSPTGEETRYRYDAERRLHEIEQIATAELTVRVWAGLRPVTEILPHGAVTQWTWAGDDVATRSDPGGNVVSFTWQPQGVNRAAPFARPLLTESDLLGLREQRSYDASGRLRAVSNGAGDTTLYGYDAQELIETLTTPDGVVRIYEEYGDDGHPRRVRVGEREREQSFDPVGNLLEGTAETAPLPGGLLSRVWDEDRNLVALELADLDAVGGAANHGRVEMAYRSDRRLLRITRPGGGDHEFRYDALGRLRERRERVDGRWQATRFEYDLAGRLAASERPNGMREEFDYDQADRIVSHRALRDDVPEGSASFAYASGQLVSVADSLRGGSESFVYDAAGRLAQVTFPEGEMLVLDYDLRSRRTAEDYRMPGGSLLRRLGFSFDAADREVEVVDQGQPVLGRSYQAGRLIRTSTGNGLVRDYAYDATTGVLSGSVTTDPSGIGVEETTITHAATAGLLSFLDVTAQTTTSLGVVAATSERYLLGPHLDDPGPYADAGRRIYAWTSDLGAYRYFIYDVLGNVTHQLSGSAFVYNAEANRLLSASTHTQGTIDYAYDEAGFATSRAGVSLTWTATGRLQSFGPDVALAWDMLGRSVSLTVDGATARWRFGGRVEADGSGHPTRIDLGEVRIDLADGSRRYRHFDFRRNVKFVSDDGGEVVTHYRYAPYGVDEVLGDGEDAVRFAGRPQLGELALLGARVYDPAVGRFLSQDPILGPVNQYAYASGNPVWFVDRDGLQSDALSSAIEDFASGTSFVAGAIAAIAAGTSVGTAALGVAIGIGGLAFALLVARRLSQLRGATERPVGTGCSPAALVAVPRPGWPLRILLLLQLAVALLCLRRREKRW